MVVQAKSYLDKDKIIKIDFWNGAKTVKIPVSPQMLINNKSMYFEIIPNTTGVERETFYTARPRIAFLHNSQLN